MCLIRMKEHYIVSKCLVVMNAFKFSFFIIFLFHNMQSYHATLVIDNNIIVLDQIQDMIELSNLDLLRS